MFWFVKQIFVSAMVLFSCNLLNVNPLKCVSINKQECKIRPEIIVFINNEPSFYLNNVKIVNVVGVMIISMIHMQNYVFLMLLKTNVKVSNLMPRTNETRHL